MRLSSAKLVKEGFEFKYNTMDEIYQDVVEYGKALRILPYRIFLPFPLFVVYRGPRKKMMCGMKVFFSTKRAL